ncbi:MAG: hypothetical protein M3198_11690 [Actinomycetota bacterium]|nr:hypothetical protein [Actinomycetota bacterium]
MKGLLLTTWALALAFFIAASVLIPTRITYGAGSLRCGTALNPETEAEMGPTDCVRVGDMRVNDAARASALLAGLGVVWSLAARLLAGREKLLVTAHFLLGSAFVVTLGLSAYWITGAYALD